MFLKTILTNHIEFKFLFIYLSLSAFFRLLPSEVHCSTTALCIITSLYKAAGVLYCLCRNFIPGSWICSPFLFCDSTVDLRFSPLCKYVLWFLVLILHATLNFHLGKKHNMLYILEAVNLLAFVISYQLHQPQLTLCDVETLTFKKRTNLF